MLKLNRNGGVGITSIVIAAMAIGALFWRVDTVEGQQAETEKRLDCIEANQAVLDENQRNTAADVGLANAQLRKLLELNGVTERIPRPDVEPSEMERPD